MDRKTTDENEDREREREKREDSRFFLLPSYIFLLLLIDLPDSPQSRKRVPLEESKQK
jgi:hypothetical protein